MMNFQTKQMTAGVVAQDPKFYSVADVEAIKAEALEAAAKAAQAYVDTYGEQFYCGFAWLSIHGVKGNTRLGKTLKAAGIEQAWDKSYQIWNPSGFGTQCMSTKEAGAQACADVFRKYGFTAYMGSRAD